MNVKPFAWRTFTPDNLDRPERESDPGRLRRVMPESASGFAAGDPAGECPQSRCHEHDLGSLVYTLRHLVSSFSASQPGHRRFPFEQIDYPCSGLIFSRLRGGKKTIHPIGRSTLAPLALSGITRRSVADSRVLHYSADPCHVPASRHGLLPPTPAGRSVFDD